MHNKVKVFNSINKAERLKNNVTRLLPAKKTGIHIRKIKVPFCCKTKRDFLYKKTTTYRFLLKKRFAKYLRKGSS